jgi:hypothetical protein
MKVLLYRGTAEILRYYLFPFEVENLPNGSLVAEVLENGTENSTGKSAELCYVSQGVFGMAGGLLTLPDPIGYRTLIDRVVYNKLRKGESVSTSLRESPATEILKVRNK